MVKSLGIVKQLDFNGGGNIPIREIHYDDYITIGDLLNQPQSNFLRIKYIAESGECFYIRGSISYIEDEACRFQFESEFDQIRWSGEEVPLSTLLDSIVLGFEYRRDYKTYNKVLFDYESTEVELIAERNTTYNYLSPLVNLNLDFDIDDPNLQDGDTIIINLIKRWDFNLNISRNHSIVSFDYIRESGDFIEITAIYKGAFNKWFVTEQHQLIEE